MSTSMPRGDHAEVLSRRLVHPGLLVGRLRLVERHVVGWLHQRRVSLAGQLAQELLRRGQRTLGENHAGRRAVVRRAGFLHVGDRDQPDLEALLRLLELAVHRLQCRLRCGERVVRREHVEIAPCDPHQQVLLGGAIVRLCECHLRIGALQRLPLRPVEHCLRELPTDVPEVRIGLLLVAHDGDDRRRTGVDRLVERRFAVRVARGVGAVRAQLRKQGPECLGLDLECRQPAGVGLQDRRVALGRGLVNLHQVLRTGRGEGQRQRNAPGKGR